MVDVVQPSVGLKRRGINTDVVGEIRITTGPGGQVTSKQQGLLQDFQLPPWRSLIGYVGQEPVLFNLSARDNVAYGIPEERRKQLESSSEEDPLMSLVVAAATQANVDFIGGENQLPWHGHALGAKGGKISGGQKQRLAIARALIRQPRILLLDEATSALDAASEKEVQLALDNLQKDAGANSRITVTIAHRLATVSGSDVIYVMNDGVLIEQGSHAELLARQGSLYTRLWRSSGAVAAGGVVGGAGEGSTREEGGPLGTGGAGEGGEVGAEQEGGE